MKDTIHRKLVRLSLALVLCVGCFEVATPPQPDDGPKDAGPVPDGGTPRDSATQRDAATQSDGTAPYEGQQHPSCRYPSLDESVETPWRSPDEHNAWMTRSCTGLPPLARCDRELPCAIGTCLFLELGEQGYCLEPSAIGEPLTFRDGTCFFTVDESAKAAACCAQIAGVDCRAFPVVQLGKPGEVCDLRSECEPGLACVEQGGVATCVCPGPRREMRVSPPGCYMQTDRKTGATTASNPA